MIAACQHVNVFVADLRNTNDHKRTCSNQEVPRPFAALILPSFDKEMKAHGLSAR